MLCYEFEILMIFENFDIFQYLIEINKLHEKSMKNDIFHY